MKFLFRRSNGEIRSQDGRHPPLAARQSKFRRQAGMALVITLSLIVLVTIAAMAFFARSISNRAIESSRANRVLAKQIADTAADYVAGQFLQEIAAKSTTATTNGVVIYQPTTNTFAVPQRPLPSAFSGTNFANLIRRSANETTNGIGETNASAHSTAAASRNGRTIGPERWNTPLLLLNNAQFAASQLPNWIYVNRDGTVTGTASTNAIGRFAYNVYDVGGLLDINVAGFPSTVAGTNLAILKSTLAGADLSVIGISDPDPLVKWRNTANATPGTKYVAAVTNSAANGFLRPQDGENRILGRQDLIKLARVGTNGITTDALPFLTAFSRTVGGASFTPDPGRPKVNNQSPALPAYGQDDAFNPSLIAVRVASPFTRPDGTTAKIGEPLLKKRFALSRLALLENAPPSVAASSDICKFFGLTRSSATSPWIYNHGQADRILTLGEVAALTGVNAREPDFFELLQACIPVGSLGKSLGKTSAYVTAPGTDVARDVYHKYQILQIGANLIDQYDADSYPTGITLADANNWTFSGIENLPYLARIFSNLYLSMGQDPANPSGPQIVLESFFLQPEVWNPHQNAGSPPSPGAPGNDGPNRFRFIMDGSYDLMFYTDAYNQTGLSMGASRSITFSGDQVFQEPRLLDQLGTATDPRDSVTIPGGKSFRGMLLGAPRPFDPFTDGLSWWKNRVVPNPQLSYLLQYERNGQWITYSAMRYHMHRFWLGFPNDMAVDQYPAPKRFLLARSDPRVERFGFILGANYDTPAEPNSTIRPNYLDDGIEVWDNSNSSPYAYPGWHPLAANTLGGWPLGYYFGALTGNKPTSKTWYGDADGENRLGDAAFSSGVNGEPMQTGNLASRPIILNRPFRSVAEMGYAGRDLPWKTLDFFTDKSADGALLDAFCLSENTSAGDIVGGMVNLNTAPVQVLAALFAGVAKTGSSTISKTEAQNLADATRAILSASPLPNNAALASKISSATNVGNALSPGTDAAIKARRESISRALGDVGQVRTWNLLVDAVAQSGQFVGGSGPGDFVVNSEQRIWKSIAVDRPGARVVASQTEASNE